MTWVMGQSTQSASLQMTGRVLKEPHGVPQRGMWRLVHGGKIIPGIRLRGWKAPLQKKSWWGSWWTPSRLRASSAPLWPQEQKSFPCCIRKSDASRWRGSYLSPPPCAGKTYLMLCPVLSYPVQEQHGDNGVYPARGKGDSGTSEGRNNGERLIAEAVQAGE